MFYVHVLVLMLKTQNTFIYFDLSHYLIQVELMVHLSLLLEVSVDGPLTSTRQPRLYPPGNSSGLSRFTIVDA